MKTLIVAVLLAAGCGSVQPAPLGALDAAGLPRVYKWGPHLYRGPQPSKAQFIAIRALEPDRGWCDIKLNTAWPGDGGHDELPDGIQIEHHPWQPFGPVTHEQILDTLDDTEACLEAGMAVYGHCLHGEDRTGLWVGMYRVNVERKPAASAWGEMRAFGFHEGEANKPALIGLVDTFKRETGYQP